MGFISKAMDTFGRGQSIVTVLQDMKKQKEGTDNLVDYIIIKKISG